MMYRMNKADAAFAARAAEGARASWLAAKAKARVLLGLQQRLFQVVCRFTQSSEYRRLSDN